MKDIQLQHRLLLQLMILHNLDGLHTLASITYPFTLVFVCITVAISEADAFFTSPVYPQFCTERLNLKDCAYTPIVPSKIKKTTSLILLFLHGNSSKIIHNSHINNNYCFVNLISILIIATILHISIHFTWDDIFNHFWSILVIVFHNLLNNFII